MESVTQPPIPPPPPPPKVLATNHVFDILVRAMSADGDLQKIEHQTLPPRKRAGWTGGDDRGPSSKPKEKPGKNLESQENCDNDPESEEKPAQRQEGGQDSPGQIEDRGKGNSGQIRDEGKSAQIQQGGVVGTVKACNADAGAVEVGSVVGLESTTGKGGAAVCEGDKGGCDAEVVDAESRLSSTDGTASGQVGGVSMQTGSGGGLKRVGKNEGDLKGGDGAIRDSAAEGKRTASEVHLDVDAKRAKTADGSGVA